MRVRWRRGVPFMFERATRRCGGTTDHFCPLPCEVSIAAIWICGSLLKQSFNEWLPEPEGLGHGVDGHAGVFIEPTLRDLGEDEEVDVVAEDASDTA